MKIIQINCVYDNGSTGKIVRDLHQYYCATEHDSFVIYGRGKKSNHKNVHKCATEMGSKARNLISRYTGNLYGMGKTGTQAIIRKIKKIEPDVVHLHCINGFFCDIYGLLTWLKENRIPTVLTLHAEFMYTGNCGYAFDCEQWVFGCEKCLNLHQAIGSANKEAPKRNWEKMYRTFEGFVDTLRVVGVSDWISKRAAHSTILGNASICTVFNGLDNNVFTYNTHNHNDLMTRLHDSGKKVLLYVTPYFEDENKGGKWLLQLADLLKGENIHIVVAGNTQQMYTLENITFLGKVNSPNELATLYAGADLCVLTSKRETFSMVCAEALSCGTPVVGFYAGAPETIALKEYSDFVEYGNVEALKNAVLQRLSDLPDKVKVSTDSCKTYSCQTMSENYLSVYKKLLESIQHGKH